MDVEPCQTLCSLASTHCPPSWSPPPPGSPGCRSSWGRWTLWPPCHRDIWSNDIISDGSLVMLSATKVWSKLMSFIWLTNLRRQEDILSDLVCPVMTHSWLLMISSRLLEVRKLWVTSGPQTTDTPRRLSEVPSSGPGSDHRRSPSTPDIEASLCLSSSDLRSSRLKRPEPMPPWDTNTFSLTVAATGKCLKRSWISMYMSMSYFSITSSLNP